MGASWLLHLSADRDATEMEFCKESGFGEGNRLERYF